MLLSLIFNYALAQNIDYSKCEIPTSRDYKYISKYDQLPTTDELTLDDLKKLIDEKK